ncbi:RNA-dependent RNA polymerase 2 [Magnolia sinica]|uniref:RNA-dependent RNA polymerase 2 n=1 Tax=Magnolia sinica TaxID=86752 RepID=UPI00265870F8|nr:RNA-dependent RNA polymerase 2 [Magnolia sinica]
MAITNSRERCTVRVSNIPLSAIASELFAFFESLIGESTVFACEIATDRSNWKSRGVGRVQFDAPESAARARLLSAEGKLEFQRTRLEISPSFEEIVVRPTEARNRVEGGALHVGFLGGNGWMGAVESWRVGVRAEVMPERKRVEFSVVVPGIEGGGGGEELYKMEIQFVNLIGVFRCRLDGAGADFESNVVLLKLKYAPKIYHKISGPTLASKFSSDRYHICKEDFDFLWVRTTDFSSLKSIGQSSYLCWELPDGLSATEVLTSFPYYEEYGDLVIKQGKPFCSASELVPILNGPSDSNLAYEIIFQINSLIHSQKICGTSVGTKLLDILSGLTVETANMILLKLHKMQSTCDDPVQFFQDQLNGMKRTQKHPPPFCQNTLPAENLMSCHRVLVTPCKVFFLGPELETSNYVVKHYAAYASDFLRVSFVEEDWNRLPSDALSTRIEHGLLSTPYRTPIYYRILSILRDGIVIGSKRFEFLAFSASQLRSNSVWMFASNDEVSAESIREWMGCFNKIRSVSKCAARMGQLFSSSLQTFSIPAQDIHIIPDIEVVTDGIKYCFSDGIGKVSFSFARQVAQKCGLNQTPSAFQIRYGGYKGVIAVDRTSFSKLSLRRSMRKFDSKNTMLCVTKWSESMPCYLNREIVCLLSTLGIEDKKFESMQLEQMHSLDKMLTNRDVALNVLEGMVGGDMRTTLIKMLLQGYEPNLEPYLLMMLKAHREFQLSDIRSKCRIFVPKGRVLLGCLDETGTLNYGQAYIRVTLTRAELENSGQAFFQTVDDKTSVVVGQVVVTKNPCLHPGDIRVLQAIYELALEETGLIDCIVFPQKGERPHPNECSGGDLDGDLYFVCWDDNLIPSNTDSPMDYIGQRPRLMDHEVTLEEIQKFFVNYMINDTLGIISTAHVVHADREPSKCRSTKCLQLASLHSMAVDFAKTGAPAEMPRMLKPKEYPDFLERGDRPMYTSPGILGKLYRATIDWANDQNPEVMWSETVAQAAYDYDLVVSGFEAFQEAAESYKNQYAEKLSTLMNYYGAETEEEILTGNLRKRAIHLHRDKKRYGEMKDRIVVAVRSLHKEALGWFRSGCKDHERMKMASAWYHVTYHPDYGSGTNNFLSFPWILSDILLNIKSSKNMKK